MKPIYGVGSSKKIQAIIAAIIGYTFFGLSFLFSKVALDVVEPFILLSLRFILAFAIINLLMLLTKTKKVQLKSKPLTKIFSLGIAHPLLYYTFENYGISQTSSAFAGTLLAAAPVITLVMGIFYMKEIPNSFQVCGAVFSFIGVIIVSFAQRGGESYVSGAILLLMAACSSVIYNLLTKKISSQFSAFERTYVMLGTGCVGFTLISLFQYGSTWGSQVIAAVSNTQVIISLFYLAACASVGSFFLLNFSFTYLPVSSASICSNLSTVVSIVAGVVVLHESFSGVQLIGSAVILLGIYISNRFSGGNRKKRKHNL